MDGWPLQLGPSSSRPQQGFCGEAQGCLADLSPPPTALAADDDLKATPVAQSGQPGEQGLRAVALVWLLSHLWLFTHPRKHHGARPTPAHAVWAAVGLPVGKGASHVLRDCGSVDAFDGSVCSPWSEALLKAIFQGGPPGYEGTPEETLLPASSHPGPTAVLLPLRCVSLGSRASI